MKFFVDAQLPKIDFEIWAPLARTVIGGLFFGSILTLYVMPVFVMGISKKQRAAIKELPEK